MIESPPPSGSVDAELAAERVELELAIADADAEVEAAAGQDRQRGGVLREPQRVVHREHIRFVPIRMRCVRAPIAAAITSGDGV